MMWENICLFNDEKILQQLRPITDHRNCWDLLIGTSTLIEKWQKYSAQPIYTIHTLFTDNIPHSSIFLLGSALPNKELIALLEQLPEESALFAQNQLIGFKTTKPNQDTKDLQKVTTDLTNLYINQLEDALNHNAQFLKKEIQSNAFKLDELQKKGNILLSPENIFIDSSADIKGSILDASSGPIFIGKNVRLSIGTLVQGPACFLEDSSTNLGAKIRPNCTIGQGCKIGGEINHSIFYPFSNKSHEGYIGSSMIGSFSNLGALTSCSNLRNDLQAIELYDESQKGFRKTNEKNIGIMMGDYVTTGVGTLFNTATWIGSHCNISSIGFPPKHIPSFTWGEFPKTSNYRFEKALEVAKAWTKLKGQNIHQNLEQRMEEIWKEQATFRT
ncbi:putative sugar nucleotidyl transferase [Aquirufa sp. ROCK-SH2]